LRKLCFFVAKTDFWKKLQKFLQCLPLSPHGVVGSNPTFWQKLYFYWFFCCIPRKSCFSAEPTSNSFTYAVCFFRTIFFCFVKIHNQPTASQAL
jgi:hypothetical protein